MNKEYIKLYIQVARFWGIVFAILIFVPILLVLADMSYHSVRNFFAF